MALFLIERNYAAALDPTAEQIRALGEINAQSGVRWLYSFLSADKRRTYCLYEAGSADAIREAARRAGLPADVIVELSEELRLDAYASQPAFLSVHTPAQDRRRPRASSSLGFSLDPLLPVGYIDFPMGRLVFASTTFLRTGALACVCVAAGCGRGSDGPIVTSPADAARTLDRYCEDCHNRAALTGGLSVTALDPAAVHRDPEVWERIVRKLRTRTMPPADAPRPAAATYESFASWLESALDATAETYPGAPALKRLNRAEYANAIRDLLDLEVDVTALLPPDDAAFGFDNIGDLLVFSPTLLERCLAAADRVSALAVGDPATAVGAETYAVPGDQSQAAHIEGLPLGTVGGISVTHNFPLDAEYRFDLTLLRNNLEYIRGLEHPHQIEIAVDGERVLLEQVGGDAEANREGKTINERSDATDARLSVRVPVKAGPAVVTAAFVRKIGESPNRLRPF